MPRAREVFPNLYLGDFAPGPLNSITDVREVLASTTQVSTDDPSVNTGVTTILARSQWLKYASYAGVFSFNGVGELTGLHWLNETGLLASPIILTNAVSIGAAHQGVYLAQFEMLKGQPCSGCTIPVVGETFDGYLNDLSKMTQAPEHTLHGIKTASRDRVKEGNVGGGTGMICHEFKGGTGSSSRIVSAGGGGQYTVGVLVQANYGLRRHLRIGGVPVGRILDEMEQRSGTEQSTRPDTARKDGSIIIVIATDAPLGPLQLQRLARRATVGLSRVGGFGNNTSGDIFLAFSTANAVPLPSEIVQGSLPSSFNVEILDDFTIDNLFQAVTDATEEAIYNALCMAETMVGFLGRKVESLPLDKVVPIIGEYDGLTAKFMGNQERVVRL